MCLIAIAHRASERYPLVIAANRDEEYSRPTIPAAPWDEDPRVIGGRDVLHGGSWLAVTAAGRFAAVTNLRAAAPPPAAKSRGLLIRSFALASDAPAPFVARVAASAHQYAGFHLVVGELEGEAIHYSGSATRLLPGVHGLSNAPIGERWPKVDRAVERLSEALVAPGAEELADEMLAFLSTSTWSGAIENEVFVTTGVYGTRSSTVVIATADEIAFYEQNFGPGGARLGELRRMVLARPG